MGSNRTRCDSKGRRGTRRAVVLLIALCAIVASGCGKGGDGASADPEKGSDAELLNVALARELTALDAYTRSQGLLTAPLRPLGRQLRAHEQEYANALTKAIRGLGGETEAEPGDLDLSGVDDQADFLQLAYELESAALADYLDAVPQLFTAAPRTLAASLAAGHAQHLAMLRQALGAEPAASVPEAFDGGQVPPPQPQPDGRG